MIIWRFAAGASKRESMCGGAKPAARVRQAWWRCSPTSWA